MLSLMSDFSPSDRATDGAQARVVIPPPPANRLTLRALAKQAKRRLITLKPPKPGSEAWLREHGMLDVGAHSYVPPSLVRVFAGDSARVRIGKWCSIAGDVEIMPGGNHRTDTVTTYPIQRQLGLGEATQIGRPSPEGHGVSETVVMSGGDVVSKGDVEIGNDVWIGRGAKILGGVTIGDGAVIAAWSVVTRSIPPYTIAAGVPARAIRLRFSQEIVDSLLRICWWDWDDDTVIDCVAELTGDDLEAFTRKYDPAIRSTTVAATGVR
jgi:acetyltransferase-like isoleucine patch superfamily enzyme